MSHRSEPQVRARPIGAVYRPCLEPLDLSWRVPACTHMLFAGACTFLLRSNGPRCLSTCLLYRFDLATLQPMITFRMVCRVGSDLPLNAERRAGNQIKPKTFHQRDKSCLSGAPVSISTDPCKSLSRDLKLSTKKRGVSVCDSLIGLILCCGAHKYAAVTCCGIQIRVL